MGFWKSATETAWNDTVQLMGGASIKTAMIAGAIFICTLVILHRWRGKDDAKSWLIEGLSAVGATVGVGLLVFLFHLVILAPEKLHAESSHLAALQSTNIANLKKESSGLLQSNKALVETNSELKRHQDQADSTLTAIAISMGVTNLPFDQKLNTFLSEFQKMKTELRDVQAVSEPNALVLVRTNIQHITNEGVPAISVKLIFVASKNQPIGIIQLMVDLPVGSQENILAFGPSLDGGAYSTGGNPTTIEGNGKMATVTFGTMGGVAGSANLILSGPSMIRLQGNNNFKPVQIDVK